MRTDARAACPLICPHHPPTRPSPTLVHHLSPAQSLVSCAQARVHTQTHCLRVHARPLACVRPPTLVHPAHLQTHNSEYAHGARARPPTSSHPGYPLSHPLPHPPPITRAFAKWQLLTHPPAYPLPRPMHACSLARVRPPTLIHPLTSNVATPRALNPLPPRSLTAQRARARCAIAPLAHPRPSLPPSPFLSPSSAMARRVQLHALCRHSSSPRPCPLLSSSSPPSLCRNGAAACTQARLHTQTSHSVCVYALARTPSPCARTSAVVPEEQRCARQVPDSRRNPFHR